MFYHIATIETLPEYQLKVTFTNGEQTRYDVQQLFDRWDCFCSLTQIPGLFELARVDAGGYGISWNDELDLSAEELYHNGEKFTQP